MSNEYSLKELLPFLELDEYISFDLETTGLNPEKDNIAEIPTNVLAKSKQYLSPIFFPKNPEIIEEIKGNNTIAYSILTF